MNDTRGMRDMGAITTEDGKTINVKAAVAMQFVQWEIFEDYDVAVPQHIEQHRGHRYVVAQWSAFGWNFDVWHCGQCQEGSGA